MSPTKKTLTLDTNLELEGDRGNQRNHSSHDVPLEMGWMVNAGRLLGQDRDSVEEQSQDNTYLVARCPRHEIVPRARCNINVPDPAYMCHGRCLRYIVLRAWNTGAIAGERACNNKSDERSLLLSAQCLTF